MDRTPSACLCSLILGLSLLCPCGAYAREQADSTRRHTMAELVVTGSRAATDVRHLSQSVTVIGRERIEQSLQPSLLPVLTEQVPGLFTTSRGVMGYGVSGGAAGAISLRGLSGGSARMIVLIDGHPQYAGIFGHPIADACQAFMADRVEVLRGPASVLYGSNAMGGVVNIVTRKQHTDGVSTHMHAGYGSFNTVEGELTNMLRRGRFSSVLGGSYNRTDGHRSDMGFEQYGGFARMGYDMAHGWNAYADVNVTHFNASCPGPVYAPLADARQRITRGAASMSVSNAYDRTSGALSFFYNWGTHWINDGYAPGTGATSQDGRFHSTDNMLGLSLYQSARLFAAGRIAVGFDWFRYGGKARTLYVSGPDAGTSRPLVDKHEDEVAVYADLRQDMGKCLTLNAGLRMDHHSRVGTEWVPQAGMAVHLPHGMELKASATKGFRYPILREMYMFPPQNPDLKPESVWNYEIALSQTLIDGRLDYAVNVFHINGKNLIQTLPNPDGAGMLNQNTGKVRNTGMEVQATFRIDKHWRVNADYSLLHMENPVLGAPEHKLSAGGSFSRGRWTLSTGLQYIAGLYTAVGPDHTEDFVLWNVRGQFRATGWLGLWLRGENLLAQEYEINAGYPMPRATVEGGVDIRF